MKLTVYKREKFKNKLKLIFGKVIHIHHMVSDDLKTDDYHIKTLHNLEKLYKMKLIIYKSGFRRKFYMSTPTDESEFYMMVEKAKPINGLNTGLFATKNENGITNVKEMTFENALIWQQTSETQIVGVRHYEVWYRLHDEKDFIDHYNDEKDLKKGVKKVFKDIPRSFALKTMGENYSWKNI